MTPQPTSESMVPQVWIEAAQPGLAPSQSFPAADVLVTLRAMRQSPFRNFRTAAPFYFVLVISAVVVAGRSAAESNAAWQAPTSLAIRQAGEHSIRITVKPSGYTNEFPFHPAVAERDYPLPGLIWHPSSNSVAATVAGLHVSVKPAPLRVSVMRADGSLVQSLQFNPNGTVTFKLDGQPILGLGEGGPKPVRGQDWRSQPVQFNRNGAYFKMEPRWQGDMYGSRNPVAMLWGTGGWGLFLPTPWAQVDLRQPKQGMFIPWQPTAADSVPQTERNQGLAAAKGRPPVDGVVPGLVDLFLFDAKDPTAALRDFSLITGPSAMPPKWALGYMQSHRTLKNDTQMLDVIDTFRKKEIPIDAVIYLGTGFCPRGWNTMQPSFTFNPEVFKHAPKAVLAEMHTNHVKVVLHMVPWDRDRLPTLHGSIPPKPGETVDSSHIQSYWNEHMLLVNAGVDAFWPDEGDWFDLFERIKRFQMYFQGGLQAKPDERPWSLQRNGYPGIAQWGGWVWSGDTESSWKTLEAQIAVGLNYSLSIGPYWGSDIGGFNPNRELTGELYARWFQFGAFCASFRAHGRVWWMRLPWAWGGKDRGPQEYGNNNAPLPPDDPRNILISELNNPTIEPVVKKYDELRYQLMPYTYTLAWEARERGLPLMRALWIYYPKDKVAQGMGTEFLWGRDLLIAPVFTKGATNRDVYLPAGDWYDWWTNQEIKGGRTVSRAADLATMPIYVRAGAIVPTDPVRQYTTQPVSERTTINIYRGANGSFTLYEDDGISQKYLRDGGQQTRFTWNDSTSTLTLDQGHSSDIVKQTANRRFRVCLHPDGTSREIVWSGERLQVAVP